MVDLWERSEGGIRPHSFTEDLSAHQQHIDTLVEKLDSSRREIQGLRDVNEELEGCKGVIARLTAELEEVRGGGGWDVEEEVQKRTRTFTEVCRGVGGYP